jgi:benzoyl-CoA-dihydrodiol lyase
VLLTFDTHPDKYRHWKLAIAGRIATLTMMVTPEAGMRDDYLLKLNSYDIGVDIELHDAVQRLRFEHPEVAVVVLTGGLEKVFCAGANIQMLAGATHGHKVNFCKFTNETRNSVEDATANSGQTWIAAVNGTAAGGGYELALACDEIVLIDDRSTAVSLPEIPLLAVLPGTGGLTRLVDKRFVRRDLADVFCTRSEGIKGEQALQWRLVDAIAPRSSFESVVQERAQQRAALSDRPVGVPGMELTSLSRASTEDTITYDHVRVSLNRTLSAATITITGPVGDQPADGDQLAAAGATAWIVAAARQLDDALLHLRLNEVEIGTFVFATDGDPGDVIQAEQLLNEGSGCGLDHWLTREVLLFWTRVLKRVDVSARTLMTVIEPTSCFAGVLGELVLASDRSFMLDGVREGGESGGEAQLWLTEANDGRHPMSNGLSRLATRFYGRDDALAAARMLIGKPLLATGAADAELVTFTPDDIDFDDDLRLALSERASFSPDALTGLEANLRFVGPETMETKIFGRLTAWQNWIFQRPNAVGPEGALKRFGSGSRASFDRSRV